jgi:hypothetical protein
MVLTRIASHAFAFKTMTEVHINSETPFTIDNGAFYSCYRLAVVDIKGCTRIGAMAFACIKSLNTISLPDVNYIGPGAFHSCDNLWLVDIGENLILFRRQYFL